MYVCIEPSCCCKIPYDKLFALSEKGSFIRFSSSCYTLVCFDVTVEVIVILYIQDEKKSKTQSWELTQFEHHHGDKQRPLISGPNFSKLHGRAGC